jgi:hypothetical protein
MGRLPEARQDRRAILLRAAYDMLKKQADSRYVISPFETTVFYDDAECDGHCLMEDIAVELGIE